MGERYVYLPFGLYFFTNGQWYMDIFLYTAIQTEERGREIKNKHWLKIGFEVFILHIGLTR